eukprot:COSAG04_NODE_398_length_14962_cov_39.977461_1_plen_47_part_10
MDYGLSPPCAEGVQPWGRPDWMAVYTPGGGDGPQRVPPSERAPSGGG